jgi:hypothetical protein
VRRDWQLIVDAAFSVGEREAADLPDDAAELLSQRADVVGDAVALADLADLGRDFRIAIGRQVREEVVLDLEAQVAGEDVEGSAAVEVGRAEQLAVVPLAAALVLGLLLGELVGAFREVPAEDDRERPDVADQVRRVWRRTFFQIPLSSLRLSASFVSPLARRSTSRSCRATPYWKNSASRVA